MGVINLINANLPANAMLNNTSFEITDEVRDEMDIIEEEAMIADEAFVAKREQSKDFRVGQDSAESVMQRMTLRDSPSEEVARKTFRGKKHKM